MKKSRLSMLLVGGYVLLDGVCCFLSCSFILMGLDYLGKMSNKAEFFFRFSCSIGLLLVAVLGFLVVTQLKPIIADPYIFKKRFILFSFGITTVLGILLFVFLHGSVNSTISFIGHSSQPELSLRQELKHTLQTLWDWLVFEGYNESLDMPNAS